MRDASGQLTNDFQFCDLMKLGQRVLPFGDGGRDASPQLLLGAVAQSRVFEDGHGADERTIGVANWRGVDFEDNASSVAQVRAKAHHAFCLDRFAQRRAQSGIFVWRIRSTIGVNGFKNGVSGIGLRGMFAN